MKNIAKPKYLYCLNCQEKFIVPREKPYCLNCEIKRTETRKNKNNYKWV